jgi:hypothetical protein
MSDRNHVGAAWSAYQMVTYESAHGAETCPLSAITSAFPPLPKKCQGKSLPAPWTTRFIGRRLCPHDASRPADAPTRPQPRPNASLPPITLDSMTVHLYPCPLINLPDPKNTIRL